MLYLRFTFNATYDQKEQQWKAGEFGKIKKDASYFEAYFHSRFADNLKKLAMVLNRPKKVGKYQDRKEHHEKFSRRTSEIEKLTKNKGIINAKEKDKLGAKTRKSKEDSLTSEQLGSLWVAK